MLGTHKWEEAKTVVENYRGGSFSDWWLPTKEELDLVYRNLRKPGIITGDETFWSSSQGNYPYYTFWAQRFGDGGQGILGGYEEFAVRAIRSFSIDEQPLNK